MRVTDCPKVEGFGEDASVTLALIVRATVVDAVRLPEVPVTVTMAVPVAAVPVAVSVSVLLPVVGFALNVAVTPLGSPDTARLTLPANPPWGITEMVDVPEVPETTVRAAGEAPMLKPGAGLTVREMPEEVVGRVPEDPVTVAVYVPGVAELLAISVITLVFVVGFGLNEAVTPPGRLDAAKLTLPVNPPWGITVMVDVVAAPWRTVRRSGEMEKAKFGPSTNN